MLTIAASSDNPQDPYSKGVNTVVGINCQSILAFGSFAKSRRTSSSPARIATGVSSGLTKQRTYENKKDAKRFKKGSKKVSCTFVAHSRWCLHSA